MQFDFVWVDHGWRMSLLRPLNDSARNWCDVYPPNYIPIWGGGVEESYAIEDCCGGHIMHAISAAGYYVDAGYEIDDGPPVLH